VRTVLCSSSPRRKEILSTVVDDFEIHLPETDEAHREQENPRTYANRISRQKAESYPIPYRDEPHLIIGCDTIVTLDDLILGKPRNYDDARRFLQMLSDKTHAVISSITLVYQGSKFNSITDAEITRVVFRHLDEQDIRNYLKRIDYTDKAGAYALQEHGEMIVERIEGSATNVIGFPLRLFYKLIDRLALTQPLFDSSTGCNR
jgi:septum formation protein